MGELGQVIEIFKDEKKAQVRLERTEACAKCRACTAGMQKEEMLITAFNNCNAMPNDWVEIELKNSNFVKAVLIMYGIPLGFLLVGAIGGYYISEFITENNTFVSTIVGTISGIALTLISYFVISKIDAKLQKTDYIPFITNVVDKEEFNNKANGNFMNDK